jgi:hypothetical protein
MKSPPRKRDPGWRAGAPVQRIEVMVRGHRIPWVPSTQRCTQRCVPFDSILRVHGAQKTHLSKRNPTSAETPNCGKAAAIGAYCNGWLLLSATAALFRRNPQWRNA